MKEKTKIILDDDQIRTERKNNLMNIENTIKNHNKGKYDLITSNIDLTTDEKFWIIDSGAKFNISSDTGINFYHEMSSMLKGIILNHPLNGDFKLKFKLNYQVLVNFYLGKDTLINFRNKDLKNDVALKTNVWHDMEFTRKEGVVSIIADGNLIRTVPSDETLFVIRVYNDNREVNIREFHAKFGSIDTDETTPENRELLEARIAYLENLIKHPDDEVPELKKELEQYKIITDRVLDSYNYLFNNIYLDYELKPKKLFSNLQTLLLELMEFVRNVCNKYDLEFWIDFGNLLGAVRHGGFIPWDDDLDICIRREDWPLLRNFLQEELPSDLCCQDWTTERNYPLSIAKVRDKNSIFNDPYSHMMKERGIYIDIFFVEPSMPKWLRDPLDFVYVRCIRGVNHYSERFIEKFLGYVCYPPTILAVWLCRLFAKMANIRMLGRQYGWSSRLYISTNDIFPTKEIQFEGHTFMAPNNTDEFLRVLYGNYMQIPPEEKRLTHRAPITFLHEEQK